MRRQNAAFRTQAKLTQARYGTINHAEVGVILLNSNVVAAIAAQSSRISTSAPPMAWRWKNSQDQARLRANCNRKRISARERDEDGAVE